MRKISELTMINLLSEIYEKGENPIPENYRSIQDFEIRKFKDYFKLENREHFDISPDYEQKMV
jgi:hypothetical protein